MTTDADGRIYAHKALPTKGRMWWYKEFVDKVERITPEQAKYMCGRVPKWEDDEPTPVINK